MSADITGTEMFESLNGFEEIAITKNFGVPVSKLAKADKFQFVRALVFIHEKRTTGQRDIEVFQVVMNLPMKEILSYFVEEEEEISPEEPETEQGKELQPATMPTVN